ncbi:MAG: DUF3179 domain-containing protein [Deltaproteobacteria bacterium]|nr:DUF3179 domain-containing protein [Deltaproteobacteria bacterium]MBW2444679.1 DUF3179 domain-containing protein [Deltaproteobacteria bacterium]
MRLSRFALALAATVLLGPGPAAARSLNGFDLEPSGVDVEEIRHGGPPRDGIPALDAPVHRPIVGAPWPEDEIVLGIALDGEARAYPVSILEWHELVNDELAGRPILVSFCPLCGTGIAFDRKVGGKTRRFGVSGLLYRSDLLMFDRETSSLWSQISAKAVTGPSQGQRLAILRAGMHRLADWRAKHPESTVLDRVTGHSRRYGETPYEGYATSEELYFPVPLDRRFHPKMPTVGLRLASGAARAFPAAEVVAGGGRVRERFAGRDIQVEYDPENQVFRVEAPDEIEVIEGFWFAWMAFHPDSSVYIAPANP